MNTASQENQTAVERAKPQEAFVAPFVDIEPTDSGYALHAEMPGVNKEGIEVTVEDGNLVITGRRSAFEVPGERIHREIQHADFRRVYELDPSIDTAKISARIEQGVLTVNLPKAERLKPRRIELV
ncbi:MAG: Hsp20/alpha crystallin family protein [Verrucomicrobia bacterium]|nr:Hsp20/alpha crystallin family protein [Verrucomicrobiota bacterium]